ncbi:energy transducer TonB [Undibacterium sp. Dicai25W]|uniref:energy transducer TonB n=1 Tax=Undibacterium sp. Dicai25W TaxID=3413034 RepID=UPI003BF00609
MNKVVKKHWNDIFETAFTVVFTGLIVAACSKNPPPEENKTAEAASSSTPASKPTGLVKNPVNHNKVADVTQWMDQASNKTAAQLAQEEKLAKEAKEAKEKLLLDAKHLVDSKAVVNKPAAKEATNTTQASAQATAPVTASSPAPAPIQTTTKPIETPLPNPVTAASQAVAATVLSSAATTKPAQTESSDRQVLKTIASSQPKYPSTAARAGITEGKVSARIHIEPDGKVSQVEILNARPKRYFEQEVIATVSQWKYAPITKAQTTVLEFTFKLD